MLHKDLLLQKNTFSYKLADSIYMSLVSYLEVYIFYFIKISIRVILFLANVMNIQGAWILWRALI